MRTILLTGKNGQVGWELQRTLAPLGKVVALDRSELDLADPTAIREAVRDIKPAIIVNPAAYTAVDKAETEPEAAHAINAVAPGVLAEEAKRLGALLVHYSTDYVFDGQKSAPYLEDDQTNPISVYGRSKLAGEEAIQQSGCDYLIFRTSWVFASRAQNFVKTILRLASEREELKVVSDQIGAPTWAHDIADATAHAVRQSEFERQSGEFASGIFNMTSSGVTSWHGFAQAIVEESKRTDLSERLFIKRVLPIPTEAYPLPAPRPKNSRLDGGKFQKHFGMEMPSWEVALASCMEEMSTN